MEIEKYVEQEYKADVTIDFSTYSGEEISVIISKIQKKEKVTFSSIPLLFSDYVLFDIEPDDIPHEGYL